MNQIEFSKEEKAELIARIQHYFDSQLDQPIGLLKAELVLEFFAKEVGATHYKKGLEDAQIALARRMDDFSEDVYQLQRSRWSDQPSRICRLLTMSMPRARISSTAAAIPSAAMPRLASSMRRTRTPGIMSDASNAENLTQ